MRSKGYARSKIAFKQKSQKMVGKNIVDFDRDERITTVYEEGGVDFVTIRSVRKKKDPERER